MSQCKVYLENYSGIYYAGSEIRGRVECYFDEEITVRGIKIRIKCKEYNSWNGVETYTDPSDHKEKTRTITLTGNNFVLNIEKMLYGSASGSHTLPRGRHVYPFSYVLPLDIPSTFNGPYGNIQYKIKAITDRPMRTDYEDEFIFVVKSPIDFNTMSQDLQDVTTYSDDKSICCWCCKGGNLTVDVELPKTAFAVGEIIPFKVKITNLSNSNVESLKIKLTKRITYKVTSPSLESKQDNDILIELKEHGVGAHGEHTYNLTLDIPNYLDAPNFTKCELFKVLYELETKAEMPSCVLDLDVVAWDIKLGHIQVSNVPNYEDNKVLPSVINNTTPTTPGYYPQPDGYPVPPPGGYLPPSGGFVAPGTYPPPSTSYPPSSTIYPPPGGYSPYSEKTPLPAGFPSAPGSIASAPVDNNPKAQEAARGEPSAPINSMAEMPPPSYNQVQQNTRASYPPQ